MVECPGDVDLWAGVTCRLLPPGFAWEAADVAGTLMHGRVKAVAALADGLHREACALPAEFICTTADRSLDLWHADYGLPDDCGINDLCLKVAYDGGARCEDIHEVGGLLGFEMCCEEIGVEIQPGHWDLGCEQMPPAVEWLEGGCDLGFLSLGHCPPPTTIGGPLGQAALTTADDTCNIAGYYEVIAAAEVVEPPCLPHDAGRRWYPPASGEMDVCGAPYRHDYTGTAYTLVVGIKGSSAALAAEDYPEVGDMELGCASLCAPPLPALVCFVEKIAHAHLNVVAQYC